MYYWKLEEFVRKNSFNFLYYLSRIDAHLAYWAVGKKRYGEVQIFNQGSPIVMIRVPPYGWNKIGEFPYKDVIWEIQAPNEYSWRGSYSDIEPEDIEVKTPPRCPQCKTELEEKRKFWGGYKWECVSCGFTKRNSESWYIEKDRAEKIAKRQFEIKVNEFHGR